ncbi:MAG: branched-chain amino acid aminotransferase [Muribaculaceae bacterium]|jgi:branched-chain amino acid aminotransferase|nr:branched-chain amino acid aminotransferase [Muribaculaceae bacterium]MBQ2370550.1 branched-chain amino acid aminotransferase [Muribaculaceae bacterium]MBQ2399741.1 branched-chain amino acid aminotransferase [Muribaculaceae bacterium]MBQ5723052.1 branched-chain amino acid aminotransferase [Muribaculaceae bacterium]MBR5788205.1 branched-chain amino acid aminotransferase [Muribaculaceae bacterium]
MKETNIDWSSLPFGYVKTDYNVRCTFKNGEWGEIVVTDSEEITMHMAATCLHYGQEAFEGLKAFRGKDGKIRVFRTEENGKRLQDSARGIMMEPIPLDLFKKMVLMAVKLNERFVPPYGSGASLYIRPFEIGTSARVGVKPADEYTFIILVTPVGPYFKNGFKPTNFAIMREFDRVAPKGTGRIKVGGNYAASLVAGEKAHDLGFSGVLYLDSKEKKYLDECGAANFFAIKDNTYITPYSESILPSITNKSLTQIAEDLGMKVERRPIEVEELATFEEAGACGTAAVCTPIGEIVDLDNDIKYTLAKDGNPGEMTTKLYNHLRGIQDGEIEDIHGWCDFVE